MAETMKAVRKLEPGPGAELVEVDVPAPAEDEVLVKVAATSICGTDQHIYQWNEWAARRIKNLPQTLGHELAGEVVEIGSRVTTVRVGDYVSAETHIPCGHCWACKTDKQHICLNLKILGVDRDGCFAEYITVPEVVVWQNDRAIPADQAAAQEPLGNALDTVLAEDVAGKTVLVTGCGPLGVLTVLVARASGATTIFATDVSQYRLDLAKKAGADHVFNAAEADPVPKIRELTDGVGVEVLLELSGAPTALAQGLKALAFGGRVSLLGLFDSDVKVDLNDGVIFKNARIYGIVGRRMYTTWYKARQFLASGTLDISPAITHTFPLEEYARGFALMASGESGKIVLHP
ncbi:MAG TPA: L-threonine 3-dehydrogenase [bacterium]|nr:L-threonine 3-dehydrogenase [bacterium]